MTLTKFIECLLPPSIDVEGCEVLIPESVFFGDDGRPLFIVKTDKDGKISAIT